MVKLIVLNKQREVVKIINDNEDVVAQLFFNSKEICFIVNDNADIRYVKGIDFDHAEEIYKNKH